jgi:hypothetical protein
MSDYPLNARTRVVRSDVYCAKCDAFLGMTCDPFAPFFHEACYPENRDLLEKA